jgi:tRNA nucleotidyltransferase (CCA-adding enzyme)
MFFTPPLVGLIFSPAIQAGEGEKKMKKILEFFSPYPAWVVGGCVRDLLLGKVPKDIDIVVQAPHQVLEQLGGVPVDPQTGIPVYVFKINNSHVEVALPRREKKIGAGYKGFKFETGPDVTLLEDLSRRDFTVNAMAMDANGMIVDPFGGQEDLRRGILRAVSPESFKDDPLRVIRAARFAARGFRVDEKTLALMQAVPAEEFRALPMERFSGELLKALHEPHPERFFEILGVVPRACKVFFPELLQAQEVPAGPQEHHPEGSLFAHIMQVVARCTTTEGRFAALMHDMGKLLTPKEKWPRHHGHDSIGGPLVKEICQRLRVPALLRDIATFVCEEHMKVAGPLRDGKLIELACRALRARADKALVEVCRADGAGEEALLRLEKALKVASIPARELGINLTGSAQTIRERILQKRIELSRK